MKPTSAMELIFRRGQSNLIDVSTQSQELYELSHAAESFSPLLQRWLLSSDKSKADAPMYGAFDTDGRLDTIACFLPLRPEVMDWRTPVAWLKKAISIWKPSVVTFGPYWYSDHTVFEDRPGASWMLYLPRV